MSARPGRVTCPLCRRPDTAMTRTGRVWAHLDVRGGKAACEASRLTPGEVAKRLLDQPPECAA